MGSASFTRSAEHSYCLQPVKASAVEGPPVLGVEVVGGGRLTVALAVEPPVPEDDTFVVPAPVIVTIELPDPVPVAAACVVPGLGTVVEGVTLVSVGRGK